MVEIEAGGTFDVVVATVAERAVLADNDLLGTPGQLRGDELVLVVALEGGA